MHVDSQELPEALAVKVDETQKEYTPLEFPDYDLS